MPDGADENIGLSKNKKKRRKGSRKLAHAVEVWALRGAVAAFGSLGRKTRMRLARVMGTVFSRIIPFRRGLVLEQLALAFPGWSEAKRKALLPELYIHLAAFGLETLALASRAMTKERLIGEIEGPVQDGGWVEKSRRENQPWILVTGHIGNWEWVGSYLCTMGTPILAVVKPMHNSRVDEMVVAYRERFGVGITRTDQSSRSLVKQIRSGGVVGIIGDQDAGRRGIFVPFFDHPASTAQGAAWLSYRLNVPIVPVWTTRAADGRHRIKMSEPIWPDPNAEKDAEILRLTVRHTQWLEDAIRQTPAQYFWVHRRWKTRPKKEKI